MTNPLDIQVKIEEEHIFFVKEYPFVHSSVFRSSIIYASEINDVCFNTFPYSLIINNNEILFLENSHRIREELISFAKRNNLPMIDRDDIWYLLTTPFLDTKFEAGERTEIALKLQRYFTKGEVRSTRWKIGTVLWRNLFFGQEWAYLGQFDYLRLKLLQSKSDYWWSMRIALRSYNN
jgi:hypothetical protein